MPTMFNGVQLEVGQKWKTRDGHIATITGWDEHLDYPVNYEIEGLPYSCGLNGHESGDIEPTNKSRNDLVELWEHADGFIPWNGGECPVPKGTLVDVKFRDGLHPAFGVPAGEVSVTTTRSAEDWSHEDDPADIIAYRVCAEQPKKADANELASEMLQALGYTFDGQCWSKDESTPVQSALDVQEGGNHYKSLAIQPVEYIEKNKLDYFQGNVVKYVTRHKSKNGVEDVKKAIHYCQLILELQYGVKA